jgi:hypothetical protein
MHIKILADMPTTEVARDLQEQLSGAQGHKQI